MGIAFLREKNNTPEWNEGGPTCIFKPKFWMDSTSWLSV